MNTLTLPLPSVVKQLSKKLIKEETKPPKKKAKRRRTWEKTRIQSITPFYYLHYGCPLYGRYFRTRIGVIVRTHVHWCLYQLSSMSFYESGALSN